MTQEDKELLLKDLCGRLPYRVMIQHPDLFRPSILITEKLEEYYKGYFGSDGITVEFIKPYLRPISSITEEEYESVFWEGCSHTYHYSSKSGFQFVEIKTFTLNILNWLNANHFDYRGLIEKGLALKASEDMYKIEDQE